MESDQPSDFIHPSPYSRRRRLDNTSSRCCRESTLCAPWSQSTSSRRPRLVSVASTGAATADPVPFTSKSVSISNAYELAKCSIVIQGTDFNGNQIGRSRDESGAAHQTLMNSAFHGLYGINQGQSMQMVKGSGTCSH